MSQLGALGTKYEQAQQESDNQAVPQTKEGAMTEQDATNAKSKRLESARRR